MVSHSSFTWFAYSSPFGQFCIQSSPRGITGVSFGVQAMDGTNKASALTNAAATQLQEYLAGKRQEFSIMLDMQGSSFQKMVWSEVQSIPYGHVLSASDIANRIGKSGSYRSVGTAIKQCQLAPFIPVHRIENPNATGAQAKLYRGFIALEKRMLAQ